MLSLRDRARTILKSRIISAEHVLLLVDMAEQEPEHDGGHVTNNGWTPENPGEVWVMHQSGESKSKGVGDTLGQEIQCRDETTHVDGRARVRDSICWDVDEEFGQPADGIWERDPPHGDGREECHFIGVDAGRGTTVVSAGTGLVGVVVENGITCAANRSQEETSGDTRNGTISDAQFPE